MWKQTVKFLVLAALIAGAAAQQEQRGLSVLARGLFGAGAGLSFLAAGALAYFVWSKIGTQTKGSGSTQLVKPCTHLMSEPIMNNRLTKVYDSLLLAKQRWSTDQTAEGNSSGGVRTGQVCPDLEQGIRAHYQSAVSLDDDSETVSNSTTSNTVDK